MRALSALRRRLAWTWPPVPVRLGTPSTLFASMLVSGSGLQDVKWIRCRIIGMPPQAARLGYPHVACQHTPSR